MKYSFALEAFSCDKSVRDLNLFLGDKWSIERLSKCRWLVSFYADSELQALKKISSMKCTVDDYSWKDITASFRNELYEFIKLHKDYQTEYLFSKLGIIKDGAELILEGE